MNEKKSPLEIIFPKVNKSIDKSKQIIFTRSELDSLIRDESVSGGLNKRAITTSKVISYLWEKGKIKEYKFEFPSRKETRYIMGNISKFKIAQSLKPKSYLTHRAAMYLNKLIDEPPETIYINVEQTKHHIRNKNDLAQASIDRAFQNKCRISNEIAESNEIKVCVVHGQKTNNLGVIERKGENNEKLLVTCPERTLIDITVRPNYAGGVKEVLKAYKKAKEIISIEKLKEILQKMDYVYPYHQAIGFYLEKSNIYNIDELQLFKKIPMDFDFYLEHKMKETNYSRTWKLYYPKDLFA